MPIHEYYERNHRIHCPERLHDEDCLLTRVAKSSAITSCIAVAMFLAGIPLTTILPTSAPIWMGFAMLLSKK